VCHHDVGEESKIEEEEKFIDVTQYVADIKEAWKHTFKLPRLQYSVMMQMFGGSVHAPINAFRLSWRMSLSCGRDNRPPLATGTQEEVVTGNKWNYQFELLFHLAGDVDAFLAHLLDGIQLTFVQADGREDGRVAEVGVRIRA
jgi:hypothetical protein